MRRVLAAYRRSDEFFVSEQEFPEEKIVELKPLFELYDDDPDMLYDYQVSDELRARVSQILGVPLNPDFDYNIEITQ
ncbi:hypothetical protein ABN034_33820 [Actinopolymorpha sp. B11F2]|uniref:DUF7683 domain-containing protein n=1 Tax=Actinopolymorpha sp. B11F2 TaxID=3160862 RepID=UPI0032E46C75